SLIFVTSICGPIRASSPLLAIFGYPAWCDAWVCLFSMLFFCHDPLSAVGTAGPAGQGVTSCAMLISSEGAVTGVMSQLTTLRTLSSIAHDGGFLSGLLLWYSLYALELRGLFQDDKSHFFPYKIFGPSKNLNQIVLTMYS